MSAIVPSWLAWYEQLLAVNRSLNEAADVLGNYRASSRSSRETSCPGAAHRVSALQRCSGAAGNAVKMEDRQRQPWSKVLRRRSSRGHAAENDRRDRWAALPQLLQRPLGRGVRRDVALQDAPRTHLQHHKNVKEFELGRYRDHEVA